MEDAGGRLGGVEVVGRLAEATLGDLGRLVLDAEGGLDLLGVVEGPGRLAEPELGRFPIGLAGEEAGAALAILLVAGLPGAKLGDLPGERLATGAEVGQVRLGLGEGLCASLRGEPSLSFPFSGVSLDRYSATIARLRRPNGPDASGLGDSPANCSSKVAGTSFEDLPERLAKMRIGSSCALQRARISRPEAPSPSSQASSKASAIGPRFASL